MPQERCEGNKPNGILPKQDTPDNITDGWESRLIIGTWYTRDYKGKADRLRASCDRFMPNVKFMGFEFKPPINTRRAAIMSRPVLATRICDVVSDDKSILWLDADLEFKRSPTKEELASLIGFEGCDRIATTHHPQITNHYSPCLSTVLFRGPLAHQFIRHWASTVNRFWDDYITGSMADTPTCNGSFNHARSKIAWNESDIFDGSLSRIWNSTKKHPADNPVIINA